MAGIKQSEPEVAAQLLPAPDEPVKDGEQAVERVTPWRGFLRSGPVSRFCFHGHLLKRVSLGTIFCSPHDTAVCNGMCSRLLLARVGLALAR